MQFPRGATPQADTHTTAGRRTVPALARERPAVPADLQRPRSRHRSPEHGAQGRPRRPHLMLRTRNERCLSSTSQPKPQAGPSAAPLVLSLRPRSAPMHTARRGFPYLFETRAPGHLHLWVTCGCDVYIPSWSQVLCARRRKCRVPSPPGLQGDSNCECVALTLRVSHRRPQRAGLRALELPTGGVLYSLW